MFALLTYILYLFIKRSLLKVQIALPSPVRLYSILTLCSRSLCTPDSRMVCTSVKFVCMQYSLKTGLKKRRRDILQKDITQKDISYTVKTYKKNVEWTTRRKTKPLSTLCHLFGFKRFLTKRCVKCMCTLIYRPNIKRTNIKPIYSTRLSAQAIKCDYVYLSID